MKDSIEVRVTLAESFLIEADGGLFLTSIDLFFKTKSATLPVSVEIRNMVNGYPGQTVMPFSVVTLNPSDVNLSSDGSTATTFTFESVYLEDKHEYCFVVYSNSNDYECFISRMGETDLITGQTISGQPYAVHCSYLRTHQHGLAEQTDDLKFHMKPLSLQQMKVQTLSLKINIYHLLIYNQTQ